MSEIVWLLLILAYLTPLALLLLLWLDLSLQLRHLRDRLAGAQTDAPSEATFSVSDQEAAFQEAQQLRASRQRAGYAGSDRPSRGSP